MAQTPEMIWDFETIKDDKVVEKSTQIADTIEGNYKVVKGIDGNGLRLDGFTTRFIRQEKDVQKPGSELTIQAWVALGEYPLNWCPVIATNSRDRKDFDLTCGYRLLIGPYGQVSFQVAIAEQWVSCTTPDKTIPLRKWVQITAVYKADNSMTLYINGKSALSLPISGEMDWAKNTNLEIGMVTTPARPSNTIRTWGTMKDYFGLDGIIDNIKVLGTALTPQQVKTDFAGFTVTAPDIAPRRLPTLKNPGSFGAFYAKLKYYPEWDQLWRVDEDPDIAVFFDKSPVKFLFWRGIRYGPCWVAENENWMTDQSLETWGNGKNDIEGCFEHMQDRHCRFSHVRMIENTDARAVVHWRYAPVSAHGHTWLPDPKTGWECWVDEYYTIYPDGSAVRKVSWNKNSTGRALQLQESLPVTQPGQSNEQLLENDYVTVADYDYNTRSVSVDLRKQPADWNRYYTVQQFNFKSKNKPYICFEPGNRMHVRYVPDGYNHFPVNQARSDGRWRKTLDRPSHTTSSPCSNPVIHEEGSRLHWNALYGMNEMSLKEVVKFGRSWAYAPQLSTGSGFVSHGYDKSERCYQIENQSGKPDQIKITLKGSKDSPVANPAFYIKNWNANGAKVSVNGRDYKDYKIGINRKMEGKDLIVFININKDAPVKVTISPE